MPAECASVIPIHYEGIAAAPCPLQVEERAEGISVDSLAACNKHHNTAHARPAATVQLCDMVDAHITTAARL